MTDDASPVASFANDIDGEGVIAEVAYLLWPLFFGVAMGQYVLAKTVMNTGGCIQTSVGFAQLTDVTSPCTVLIQTANTNILYASGVGALFFLVTVVYPVLREERQ